MSDLPQEILDFRSRVKASLPIVYDFFWEICDRERYFDFELATAPLRRFKLRNALLRSGTRSVRWAYEEFIETAALARAADVAATASSDSGVGTYLRFKLRNRMAADAARHYFRFLDHVTHHLFEVSGRRLMPGRRPHDASFGVLRKLAKKRQLDGSRRLQSGTSAFLACATASLTAEGWRLIYLLRNVDTHRYVVGIDHITYGVSRNDEQVRVREYGRLLTVGDASGTAPGYSWFGHPDVDFQTVDQLLRVCMTNAEAVMRSLAKHRLLLHDPNF